MSDDAVKTNKKNKRKGEREELACRNAIREVGFPAARTVPLSGTYSYLGIAVLIGDVKTGFKIGENGREGTVQVKSRKTAGGFQALYNWLDANTDFLWLRRDRHPSLIVMNEQTFFFFLSLVPQDLRLPADMDRLKGLKLAARSNPYARATLERIQGFGKASQSPGDQESDNLANMLLPDEAVTESKPPF